MADRDAALARAIRMRGGEEAEAALTEFLALAEQYPDDPEVVYHTAWAHDRLGLEAEAAPLYERALAGAGLPAADRRSAFVGLGSTYRVLGRYDRALATLRAGLAEFPGDGAMRAFEALTRHNLGESGVAVGALLKLLVETSGDAEIQRYGAALSDYADELNETV
jgi:tetratricopeptide (TPR) repeat protein